VTGSRRKLHNEELHNLHSSPSIIRMIKSRRIRWAGHVARVGDKRNANMILVGNPEGKRPLGRPRSRWVDNIIRDLREIGFFSGVGLSPLGTAATVGLLYQPQMIDEGVCGAIGGMKIGRGNQSTRRKPSPAPLGPP
jgi:hypothetical protein